MKKEHRKIAQRVEWAQRLEGSRFVAWQLYRLAADGSRERLEVRQFYGRCIAATEQKRWAKHRAESFPGAAC